MLRMVHDAALMMLMLMLTVAMLMETKVLIVMQTEMFPMMVTVMIDGTVVLVDVHDDVAHGAQGRVNVRYGVWRVHTP